MVYLSDSITFRAQTLVDDYILQGMDAIQLASALTINVRLLEANQPSLVFVCADNRLLNAANSEGLPTHNPV
jgi:predicted nucleic acid-binding protein